MTIILTIVGIYGFINLICRCLPIDKNPEILFGLEKLLYYVFLKRNSVDFRIVSRRKLP